jgi:2-methylisocitrate lyase-like PEP mutase family enzyme
MTPAFHRLHQGPAPLLLPNAWDFGSAAALAQAGFAAIGTTSLGVAASYGLPDAAGATEAETLALARSLGRLPALITVDVEGGFGHGPSGMADLAERLAAYGVAGINLEDGRADGELAGVSELCALVAAVKERVPDLFVNARTDAYWLARPGAEPLPEALARVRAYAEAGADGVFVPGLARPEEIEQVVAATALPLNVLLQPGALTVPQLGELGVARVSTGSLLYRAAVQALVDVATAARDGGEAPAGLPSYADIVALLPAT